MPAGIEDIQNIKEELRRMKPAADQPPAEDRFELRNRIVERIRRIAGQDSIKRIVPIQSQGDHKEQDIVFDMGERSYTVTVYYNNALTEGWVSDLKEYPKKC
jgi:hypothetical protein